MLLITGLATSSNRLVPAMGFRPASSHARPSSLSRISRGFPWMGRNCSPASLTSPWNDSWVASRT